MSMGLPSFKLFTRKAEHKAADTSDEIFVKKSVLCVVAFLLILSCGSRKGSPQLEAGFRNPPHESRPMVLWHWMNGNVTKDGIRKDLLWMHDMGLSGFSFLTRPIQPPR